MYTNGCLGQIHRNHKNLFVFYKHLLKLLKKAKWMMEERFSSQYLSSREVNMNFVVVDGFATWLRE